MIRRLLLLCLTSLLAALLLSGCKACSRSAALATLQSKQGEVKRNQAAERSVWNVADVGVAFGVGDALRTARAASAMLSLDGGGKLQVRGDTTLRFQNRRPSSKSKDFDVETGQVLLEAGAEELLLATGIGVARIEPNGSLLIRRTADGVQFDVTVGRARFESGDAAQTLEPGQSYVVNVGNAVIEKTERPDAGHSRDVSVERADAGAAAPADSENGVSARVTGSGVSLKGPSEQKWTSVAPGVTRIRPGATVRVQTGSSVELERGHAKVALSGAGSYNVKANGDAFVELQSGHLSVSGATRIVVPGGVIETTENSAAALETLGKNRTRVRVAQGSANLIGTQGSTKVSAGEEATLSADGSTKLDGRGLAYFDITADAGESFVVHDPKPPTAVRLLFGSRCSAGGTIRVGGKNGGQFASGESSAALGFGVGRSDYALYCLTDGGLAPSPVARGTLTILRDAGTRPVPTTPPSTSVNVDGRNYTVMYQNQLPSLTVVWPNAPQASNYTLYVESRGGTKTYATSSPSHSFKSGTLAEGRHTFYFDGGGRISRHTSVEITFDNAAPMASLMTPVAPEVGAEGDVTVAGVAQPGWQVEIGGDKVAQDGQQRFSRRMPLPTAERALAVKLIHPTRGVHIYLRRAARAHD
jgi:hypothetical protein